LAAYAVVWVMWLDRVAARAQSRLLSVTAAVAKAEEANS
jgi:hypothetical protein